MTTELERLKVWMEENHHDTRSLAKATGIPYTTMYRMMSGMRPISAKLQWRFAVVFGAELAIRLLISDKKSDPEIYAAHKAIARARKDGELLPATAYKCCSCDKQAKHWHHPSYHSEDRLCVVPLCRTCHANAHHGNLDVSLGIIPTVVGIVRIAISELQPV